MKRAGKSRRRPIVETETSHAAARARSRPARGARSRLIRIIGGSLRGRRFRFADVDDIRPTPDRVRETLFNWLGSRVVGARCLDLFAGSGALGLEGRSRGAAHVVLVERHPAIVRTLAALLEEWRLTGVVLHRADALQFLSQAPEPFDIVFLDPPFGAGVLSRVADMLEHNGWLTKQALIYVECAARDDLPPLPPNWRLLKAKRAGEVGYHLLARTEGDTDANAT